MGGCSATWCARDRHALGLRHNLKATAAVGEELRDPRGPAPGHSASTMSYARFNYVATTVQPVAFGPYDYSPSSGAASSPRT